MDGVGESDLGGYMGLWLVGLQRVGDGAGCGKIT